MTITVWKRPIFLEDISPEILGQAIGSAIFLLAIEHTFPVEVGLTKLSCDIKSLDIKTLGQATLKEIRRLLGQEENA